MRSFRITLFVAVLLITWIISIPANAESKSSTNPTWIAGQSISPEQPSTYLIRSDANLPARRVITDEIQALADQITEMKTQGLYDQSLWDQYFDALYPDRTHFQSGLDQGGDDCATAANIGALPFSDTGTTAAYNDDYDYAGGFTCPWESISPDVVYSYAPLVNETVNISLCNSLFDTKLIVYEDVCDSANCYDCDDDGCGYVQGYTSQINELDLYAGHTYYIVVDGYGGDEGDYSIEVEIAPPRPPNDDCENAIPIGCNTIDLYVDLEGATRDCQLSGNGEVWYTFSLDPTISSYWNVALSYCDSDPNISLVSAYIQNDCLCDDAYGWSSVSGTVCTSPAGLPEYIYIEGVPAGQYWVPIFTDLNTYVIFDLLCEPADCPEIDCVGIPEIPNDGGCWEPPFESQIIDCGTTICGDLIAEPPIRDTDWYQITVAESTVFTWKVEHESPLDVWISVCDIACTELYFADDSQCEETIVTDPLPPGTYFFYVAHHTPFGVPVPTDYVATLYCGPGTQPVCPYPEIEPNNHLPVVQEIAFGDTFCGVISSPNDTDMVNLNVPEETAIRIHLNTDGILHPAVWVVTKVGDGIALGLDTTNLSDQFTSDFKLGQDIYAIMVQSANHTTGTYELRVEAEILPTISPPDPVVTLQRVGDQIEVMWFAEYFPDEMIRIERSDSVSRTWTVLATVPGDQTSYLDTNPPEDKAFYRAIAIGDRDVDPYIGSVITLSEWDGMGGDEEFLDFEIQDIRWAVDSENRITMSRLLAQGVPPDDNYWIDSDLRLLLGSELTAIRNFNGHILGINGTEVLLDHIAFGINEVGEAGIIDGFGTMPRRPDTTLYFAGHAQTLQGNNMPRQFGGQFCVQTPCCRLKVIAICAAAPWAPRFPCNFPPPQSAPQACEIRTRPFAAGWLSICICPRQSFPPIPPGWPGYSSNPMLCQFYPVVKCKWYWCPELWYPEECWCPVGIMPPGGPNPCPTYPKLTIVPFVNRAMRNACRVMCRYSVAGGG